LGTFEQVQAPQDGGLSRPRGTDDRHDLALVDRQAEALQDGLLTKVFVKTFDV